MKTAREYILERENMVCLFVLLDSRLKPQRSDLEFMEFLGIRGVPFARIFTKTDKVGSSVLMKSISFYDNEMLGNWESLPVTFISSAVKKTGREEILDFIEESLNKFSNKD
jgi:GTP-binding protein